MNGNFVKIEPQKHGGISNFYTNNTKNNLINFAYYNWKLIHCAPFDDIKN